jgi:hypothetical protein
LPATSTAATLTVNPLPTITLGASPSVCSNSSSASLPYTATTASPTKYYINYDGTAESAGFVDTNNGTFAGGSSGNIPITVPPTAAPGTYNATLIVSNATCASTSTAFTVTINQNPTITLGASPTICQGTTSANLPYSGTSGAPDNYSIAFDGPAITAGFTNVVNKTLGESPIGISVPGGAAAGTYNGTLTVKSNATSCTSGSYAFTITLDQPGGHVARQLRRLRHKRHLERRRGRRLHSQCQHDQRNLHTYAGRSRRRLCQPDPDHR